MFVRALTVTAVAAAVGAPAAAARDPIVPLSDVHRGMTCTARTVVQGTTITDFGVEVLDVVDDVDGSGPRILVRVSGDAVAGSGIASGFSGSPVYCARPDGSIGNAGAVSATVGQYGNDVGLVTPIESMLKLPLKPPSGARTLSRAAAASVRAVDSPLTIGGLSPALGKLVERSARAAGRTIVATPAGPLGTFAPQPLVPGASMGAAYATGALALSAIGTVTYRDGDTIWGFGHQFDGVGRRALPLQDAYVYTVVDNPLDTSESTSYKLASPGHTLGVLSNDAASAVVGGIGARAPTTPVTVNVRDKDRKTKLTQTTLVADESAVGDPLGHGLLPTVAPISLMQAITKAFEGAPARETGSLCLTVRVRGVKKPLRFCDRYVVNGSDTSGVPALATAMGNDVTNALGAIDGARYAALHVDSVRADVTIERGLRLATIRSLSGPATVKRGQRVRLRMQVREDRGPMKTIPLTLTIPRDAKLGQQMLTLSGTALDQGGSDGDTITIVLDAGGGESAGSSGGAQTFAQVKTGFGSAQRWDGVKAKLGKLRWRATRDPQMRIDGRGQLALRVVRGG
ncbi:hypothetical protein Q5424_08490 [Conexibacter sp. JD483]|uniref:hypothetical protein n=1 Tax=unclassified Conexibacter TaxID=2627773 RepID=UPI002724D660|nr:MULTISPECIES: hypothetical protein [unclassified Conexibacter]MDO8186141.1 hypothetical protein [Conexibacter sp. CPCC 205706]MDO8199631.1 hypothetical protein [Conexibacter sp. CPCC 205762]MDR9369115.1 hypothetical protein [Conexibacter sp. JD483]